MKIEATCTPVAPPPMTSIDGGTEVKSNTLLWVLVSWKPGIGSLRLTPPAQMMILSARSFKPVSVTMVWGRQSAPPRRSRELSLRSNRFARARKSARRHL